MSYTVRRGICILTEGGIGRNDIYPQGMALRTWQVLRRYSRTALRKLPKVLRTPHDICSGSPKISGRSGKKLTATLIRESCVERSKQAGKLAGDTETMNEKIESNQTVVQLVNELNRQQQNKFDIVSDTRNMQAIVEGGHIMLEIPNMRGQTDTSQPELFREPLTHWAHGQLAEKLEIPERYYRRMQEEGQPDLLAQNINTWMQKKPHKVTVRTLDRNVRAIVSDKFRTLENRDLAFLALDCFTKAGAQVIRADMSDRHLYIKATTPMMQGEVRVGDIVQGGLLIRNSEVGASRLAIQPFVNRLRCTNGMVIAEMLGGAGFSQIHLGGRKAQGVYQFSDQTMQLENLAIFSKIRDVIRQTFEPGWFNATVAVLKATTENKVPLPERAIGNVVDMAGLPDSTRDAILRAYLGEPDPTQYGIVQSITATAKACPSPEDRVAMEELGGRLALMPAAAFIEMAEKPIEPEAPKRTARSNGTGAALQTLALWG